MIADHWSKWGAKNNTNMELAENRFLMVQENLSQREVKDKQAKKVRVHHNFNITETLFKLIFKLFKRRLHGPKL